MPFNIQGIWVDPATYWASPEGQAEQQRNQEAAQRAMSAEGQAGISSPTGWTGDMSEGGGGLTYVAPPPAPSEDLDQYQGYASQHIQANSPQWQAALNAYNTGQPVPKEFRSTIQHLAAYHEQGQAAPGKLTTEMANASLAQWNQDSSDSPLSHFVNWATPALLIAGVAMAAGGLLAGEGATAAGGGLTAEAAGTTAAMTPEAYAAGTAAGYGTTGTAASVGLGTEAGLIMSESAPVLSAETLGTTETVGEGGQLLASSEPIMSDAAPTLSASTTGTTMPLTPVEGYTAGTSSTNMPLNTVEGYTAEGATTTTPVTQQVVASTPPVTTGGGFVGTGGDSLLPGTGYAFADTVLNNAGAGATTGGIIGGLTGNSVEEGMVQGAEFGALTGVVSGALNALGYSPGSVGGTVAGTVGTVAVNEIMNNSTPQLEPVNPEPTTTPGTMSNFGSMINPNANLTGLIDDYQSRAVQRTNQARL